jgi:hypothetical protein
MAEEDKDSQREILTAAKVDKDEEKGKEESKDKAGEPGGRDQPAPGYGQYPPPPGAYPPPPPREPMMTAERLHRFMAIGILIGILILFVGTLLIVSANFMDPYEETDPDDLDNALDLQRNVGTSGGLINCIGLFLMGIFIVLPLMIIRELSDKQRAMLVIILASVILGFSFLSLGFVYF